MGIIQEAKAEVKQNKKEAKQMKNQPRIETFKTILITVLVTGIVSFIGGSYYEAHNSDKVNAKAQSIVQTIKAETSKQ